MDGTSIITRTAGGTNNTHSVNQVVIEKKGFILLLILLLCILMLKKKQKTFCRKNFKCVWRRPIERLQTYLNKFQQNVL